MVGSEAERTEEARMGRGGRLRSKTVHKEAAAERPQAHLAPRVHNESS